MRRRFFLRTSTLGLATSLFILTSCSTPQTRISEHSDLYQTLSQKDQALVSQGQIRIGMPRTAVWLAWGSPIEKSLATWMADGRKLGFILIMLVTHTIRITPRGTSISVRLCMIRLLIPGSRKVFLILARWSLSPTAGLRLSGT